MFGLSRAGTYVRGLAADGRTGYALSVKRRKAVLLLSVLVGGPALLLAAGEVLLRNACFSSRAVDVLKSHHVATAVWPSSTVGLEDGADAGLGALPVPRVLKPGLRITRKVCGERMSFTTRACPDPRFGYRMNGGDEGDGEVYALVLGDSMTEGAHVDDSETYSSVLTKSTKKRFVNLGVFAQGTTGHLERLRLTRFLERKPRVIILQTNPNDAREDAWLAARGRGASGAARGSGSRWRRAVLRRSVLLRFLWRRLFPRRGWAPRAGRLAAPGDIQERNVGVIHELALRSGAKLLVVEDGTRLREAFAHLPPDSGPAFIEVGLGADMRVWAEGHWNRKGHEEAALLIQAKLYGLGWL